MTTSNDRETSVDRSTYYIKPGRDTSIGALLLQSHTLPFHFTQLNQHYTITVKVLTVEYIYYKYIST
jgi:hypothetical protein